MTPTRATIRSHHRRLLGGFAVAVLCSVTAAGPVPRETPLNPTDHDYLYRQHVWFQAQDPEAQHRYRKLHAAYEALPADEQIHLARVLQNYQSWLARLPEADRQQVYDAPPGAGRLAVVRRLKEEEWVATLPVPYRKEYAELMDDAARRQKVADWRIEEADRLEEWAVAQRNWPDFLPGRQNALQNELLAVEWYVENLKLSLADDERRRLDLAREAIKEQTAYFPFFSVVANLADTHPLTPGCVGPKDFASLPPDVKDLLTRYPRSFKKKGDTLVPVGEDSKELRRTAGRWPDFAIELTRYCQRHGIKDLPPLGDCLEEDMPPEAKDALKRLREQVKRSKEAKGQLEQLDRTQGRWPDYPLKLVELCRRNQIPLPGWTLPGPPQAWDKLKARRGKGK